MWASLSFPAKRWVAVSREGANQTPAGPASNTMGMGEAEPSFGGEATVTDWDAHPHLKSFNSLF